MTTTRPLNLLALLVVPLGVRADDTLPRYRFQPGQQLVIERYGKAVNRYLLAALCDSDAADELSQEFALGLVSGAFQQVSPERGRFRDWLFRIARNTILNFLTRHKQWQVSSGNSDVRRLIEDLAEPDRDSSVFFELEYRREVFRWAANQIRPEFRGPTWEAFWLTGVENLSVEEVSKRLQLSCGAIYAARSRVMRRIQEKVAEYEQETSR